MYTENFERVQRFRLALRMGIPIILLTSVMFFSLITQYMDYVPYKFIIIVVGLLAVSVYFQFYLIYQGFIERTTDNITHTFTREYFTKLFNKRVKKTPQTIILYSVDNLHDINYRLGIKNGDKLLYSIAKVIDTFLKNKGISKPIISHHKGGDFIIMIDGELDDNRTLFDIFCTKIADKTIDNIEIKSSEAIIDSNTSIELEKLIDRLFELQRESQEHQKFIEDDKTDLDMLEQSVIEALKANRFSVMIQNVKMTKYNIFDTSFKLVDIDGKLIHQKRFLPILGRLSFLREYELMKIKYILQKLEKFPNYYFALTISADSLRDYNFKREIKSLLEGIKNPNLIFVIQEKEYYPNAKRYNMTLQEYRDLGLKILIDGLGNNHTTQLYMKDLDIDFVRFDGSYGKKIEDKRYKSIVTGLNLAAKNMQLYTWIRMINTVESLNIAKEIGIDAISGNILAKMIPIESIKEEEK